MLNTTKTERFKSTEKCVIQIPLGPPKRYSMQKQTTTKKPISVTLRYSFSPKEKRKRGLIFISNTAKQNYLNSTFKFLY